MQGIPLTVTPSIAALFCLLSPQRTLLCSMLTACYLLWTGQSSSLALSILSGVKMLEKNVAIFSRDKHVHYFLFLTKTTAVESGYRKET